MQSPITVSPLEQFLEQQNIEESPAWEFINGRSHQKPMPTLFHSRLQRNLVNLINQKLPDYEAIQELRCIVPPFSPVPDIAVIAVEKLSDTDGPFQSAPDWLIEIRSPDHSLSLGTIKLQEKILHCMAQGTQLAWLVDIQKQQIWVWQDQELPLIYAGDEPLPTPDKKLVISVTDIMAMTQRR